MVLVLKVKYALICSSGSETNKYMKIAVFGPETDKYVLICSYWS